MIRNNIFCSQSLVNVPRIESTKTRDKNTDGLCIVVRSVDISDS